MTATVGSGRHDRWPAGVTVRPATPEDRDLLVRHFERLPADDRRLRFFGPGVAADHADRWLGLAAHGGVTILALRTEDAGRPRCVGEACFVARGDGTAEFALSVAADARGGLGSALLEELRDLAAERGIAGLHGDVLADNGPMNHLLRRRGGVTVERRDRSYAGVVIRSTAGAPPWPDTGAARRRVLVESNGGHWPGEELLRAAGYEVAVCPGPQGRLPADPCPLLVGRSCPLVDGADVVVHDLPGDLPAHGAVAAALPAAAGRTPVLVRGPGADPLTPEAVEVAIAAEAPGRSVTPRNR